jgi:hypothetical protein
MLTRLGRIAVNMNRCTRLALVAMGIAGCAMARPQAQVSQAEVRLEAKDGKTQFQLGDVIRLELVFRDPAFAVAPAAKPITAASLRDALHPATGQLMVNSTDYGDIADSVTISPATGWFQWQGRSGHDYSTATPVDAAGVRVPIVLNQGYVFREPGHYEISVTTRRMGSNPVTTNTVAIDIAARSAGVEAKLVKNLNATIARASKCGDDGCNGSGLCKLQGKAAEQLAYLTGDDAARAKVKWLLDGTETETMIGGLAATRNQALQLELLKAAWADPSHVPDNTLQQALKSVERFARGQMEPGWVMVAQAPKNDSVTRELAEEYRQDLDRAIATLPQRTGSVRRDTVYSLIEDNDLSADQLALVKPVALDEFAHMEPLMQSMLIETRWNAIKDPSLAPALQAMIGRIDNDTDASTAMERLVELEGSAARPYVAEMVCRPQRGLLLDKLKGVTEDRLPEVDSCLSALLAKGERREHDFDWEQQALRAARFATPAILPAVKPAWTNPSQDATMLALLMRDAPQEAVALLEREPGIEWYPAYTVYETLNSKFPPEVLAWLRGPHAPTSTLEELARFGEAQDRALLEQRLAALHAAWQGREAEIEIAQPKTPAYQARNEESSLVGALLGAKAWTLTDEEKQQLVAGCMSVWCRAYAPHPAGSEHK